MVAVAGDPLEGLGEFGEVAHRAVWGADLGHVGDGDDLFAVAVGDGGSVLGHEFRGDVAAVVFVVEGESLVAKIAACDPLCLGADPMAGTRRSAMPGSV